MTTQTTIFPALPGTYKLYASEMSDCTLRVSKAPVVAWAVIHDVEDDHIFTSTYPVTIGIGNYSSRGLCSGDTVLLPCGTVEEMGSEKSWNTYEGYVKSHEADMKREKARNDKN